MGNIRLVLMGVRRRPEYASGRATVRFSFNCGLELSDFVAVLCHHGEKDGRVIVVQML